MVKAQFSSHLAPRLMALCLLLLPATGLAEANTRPSVETVTWASPDGFDLTMDIYTPSTGLEDYPVIVMFHGGGFLINDKSIMDEPAEYLATQGNYVVCNVNYRLLVDQDNTVTIDEIVQDAFGATLWVKANITRFKGDPARIIVTGDSAGGHLASMVATHGDYLSSAGISGDPWGFTPSWLPEGLSAEEIAANNGLDVQAAVINYGVVDLSKRAADGFETKSNFFWTLAQAEPRGLFGDDKSIENNPELYRRGSANQHLRSRDEKKYPPMLFTAGENDKLISPEMVQTHVATIQSLGHPNIDYWEHAGRPHAFLDSGSNEFLGISFEEDAIPALEVILEYLDAIFYPE